MSFLKLALPSHTACHSSDCLIHTPQGLFRGCSLGAGILGGSSEFCLPQHNLLSFHLSSWQQVDFSKWAEPSAVLRLCGPGTKSTWFCPQELRVAQYKPSWIFSLPWDLRECLCNQEAPKWSCFFSSLPVPRTSLAVPKRRDFVPSPICCQSSVPVPHCTELKGTSEPGNLDGRFCNPTPTAPSMLFSCLNPALEVLWGELSQLACLLMGFAVSIENVVKYLRSVLWVFVILQASKAICHEPPIPSSPHFCCAPPPPTCFLMPLFLIKRGVCSVSCLPLPLAKYVKLQLTSTLL